MKLNWIVISMLFAATASAQMTMNMDMSSHSGKFMTEMDASMKVMDHDMSSAP